MNEQQNPHANESLWTKKNAAYYRAKARTALKPCYGTAILISAIASALGGSVIGGFSGGSVDTSSVDSEKVNSFMENVQTNGLTEALSDFPLLPVLIGVFAFAFISAIMISIFVSSPVMLGYQRFNLNVIDGKGNENPFGTLFSYFRIAYKKSVVLYLLYSLLNLVTLIPMIGGTAFVMYAALRVDGQPEHTAYLSLLLLALFVFIVCCALSVVLSILVQYRYCFSFIILAEYPTMRPIDALRNSATLMKGNKWRLFCLEFSFIGWIILSVFTCGIGMIFLAPYMSVAQAAFYDDIANRTAAKEAEFPSLDPDDYRVDEQDWWTQQQ